MGWTPIGYNAVITAMQRRDDTRRELEIARQDGLPTVRTLEGQLELAETDLRKAQDAISSISPSFVSGSGFRQRGGPRLK